MTVFAGVLYSLWIVLKKVLVLLSPVFLIILLFVIGRMFYRHKKYGYDYFDVFKKKKETNASPDIIQNIICQIDKNAKIRKEEDTLIAMTKVGMICISVFPYQNVRLDGNLEDETLTCIQDGKQMMVQNPFLIQEIKIQKLKQQFDIPIFSYVLFDTLSLITLKGKSMSQLLRKNQLYFELEKMVKEQSHYNKEEIEFYFNQLQK